MGIETEFDDAYDISQRTEGRSAAVLTYESNKLTPLCVALAAIALLVAGISLGFALKASADADAARRQARASEMRVEGFTRALMAHGVDPYPHLKGEDP